MNLTTKTRIKTLDSATYKGNEQDSKLDIVIAGVSARAENYLERTILTGDYVELFNVTNNDKRAFFVKAFPVTTVTYFHELAERSDANYYNWDLSYLSWADNTIGRVAINAQNLYQGFGSVEISYTGGMATDTADFIANYPDLAYHIELQVLFEMQMSNNLVDRVTAIGDQTITKRDLDWLPNVKKVLDKYKRRRVLF